MAISGYDCWKRKSLSQLRKLESVGAETTSSGSPFSPGAEGGPVCNFMSPNFDS